MLKELILRVIVTIIVIVGWTLATVASQDSEIWFTNGLPVGLGSLEKTIKSSLLLDLTERELITQIKNEHNITIVHGPNKIFSRPMLAFLYKFLNRVKELEINRNFGGDDILTFREYNETSVVLVERRGQELYFSKNSAEKLFETSLKRTLDAIKKNPEMLNVNSLSLGVDFNNELYLQLAALILDTSVVKEILQRKYGLSVEPESMGEYSSHEIQFDRRELLTILKQLEDLPLHISSQLKLKSVVRMRTGFLFGSKDVLGHFDEKDRIIRLTDFAFRNDVDITGEATLLHEIAHAYWFSESIFFREDYTSYSWQKGRAGLIIKPSASSFVTEYSRKSPAEDFAEHFSYYINMPRRIRSVAKEKYKFLKTMVFKGAEYYSDAIEALKVEVKSKLVDSSPPYFLTAIGSRVDIRIEKIDAEKSKISFLIKGVKDDISTIKGINIWLKKVREKGVLCDKIHCERYIPGFKQVKGSKNNYRATTVVNNSWLVKGTYKTSLSIGDMSGNYLFYSVPEGKNFHINGSYIVKNELAGYPNIQVEEVHPFVKIEQKSPFSYELEIPIPHSSAIIEVEYSWRSVQAKFNFFHLVELNSLANEKRDKQKILSKNGDKNIRVLLSIPEVYPSDRIELSGVRLSYKIYDKEGRPKQLHFTFPEDRSNLQISHVTRMGVTEAVNVDLNKIEFYQKRLKQPNLKGGLVNLVVSIPILNEVSKNAELFFHATVTTPDGKQLMNSGRKEGGVVGSAVDLGVSYDIIKKKGRSYLETEIPLLPYHQEGTAKEPYILKGLKLRYDVRDKFDSLYDKGKNYPKSDNFHMQEILTQQRGKSLRVIVDPNLRENVE